MKTFDIWIEGYSATGEYQAASKLGEGIGDTFDDAVRDWILKNPNTKVKEHTPDMYANKRYYEMRRSNWSIWACCLFDNEADARKSFG